MSQDHSTTLPSSDASREDLNKIPQAKTPWTILESSHRGEWSHWIDGADKRLVAAIAEQPDATMSNANARLVAAAPDLLSALKRCRDTLYSAVQANVDIPGFDPAEHFAIKAADEVIARAEGRAS